MSRYVLLILFCVFLSTGAWAASELGLKNITPFYFVFTGSSNLMGSCKGECYQVLPENAEQWVKLESKDAWMDIQYNVCEQINYNQPDPCVGYLGHFSISFAESQTRISSSTDGAAKLSSYVTGRPFQISFTPDKPGSIVFPAPSSYSTVPCRGINLTGAEYDYAFQLPDPESALFFVKKGMNSIRLPFKWEYLQSAIDLGKPLDFSKGNAKKYVDLVKELTDAKIRVIVDMHNYMRYESGIIGVNAKATTDDYASIWGDFARQFKDNKYILFDLMNEPHDMQTSDIVKNYNAAIAAIREQGFKNTILLEGNKWSGLDSWTTGGSESNAATFAPNGMIQDPMNNFAVNVHQYFDTSGGTSGVCIAPDTVLKTIEFEKFITWLHENHVKAYLTETGGAENENCALAINALLTGVEANPDVNHTGGFIGWNAWDGGRNRENAPYRKNDLFYLGDVDTPDKIQMQKGFGKHLSAPGYQADMPVTQR